MPTVPMLAPDGTSGEVPQEQVQAAIAKGFKQAVEMTSPDGKAGYIPMDRQQDALKAGFKPVTAQSEAPPEGLWHSLGSQLGITAEAAKQKLDEFRAHPIQQLLEGITGQTAIDGLTQGLMRSGSEVKQAYQAGKQGNTAGVVQHAVTAIPIVGPAMDKLADQQPTPKPGESYLSQVGDTLTNPGSLGTLIGASAQAAPAVLGVADATVPGRPVIPNPAPVQAGINAMRSIPGTVSDAAAAAKSRFYPSTQSATQQTMAARNLAKALVVSPQAAPSFIRAATDEAGTIVDYAQKNNIPINSKVDFANAAKQAADAVQAHFDDALLGPNAKQITSVPANYRGATVGEGPNATLGSINDRINTINQELNPNYRKGLASQTSAANVSDADLIAEKQALTNILHNKLAQATGLQPSDIAAVRQQAGKLRTIADEAQMSANTDTAAAGKQAMGGTTVGSIGSKAGLVDRLILQPAQGGPEIIGNRQVNTALRSIRPQPLNLPQPTSTGVPPPSMARTPVTGNSTGISGPEYTPDPTAADVLKARIQARQPATQVWTDKGATNLATEGLSSQDLSALKAKPEGQQLLLRASSMKPGSAVMKSLALQARRILSN